MLQGARPHPSAVEVERQKDKGGGSMFISLLSTSFFFTKYIYYFIIFKLYLINLQTTIYRIAGASASLFTSAFLA